MLTQDPAKLPNGTTTKQRITIAEIARSLNIMRYSFDEDDNLVTHTNRGPMVVNQEGKLVKRVQL